MAPTVIREMVARLFILLHSVDSRERDEALVKLQACEQSYLRQCLIGFLNDRDPDTRCDAAEAMLRLNSNDNLELVIPLLADPDQYVRSHVCGLLHDFGDKRAITELVKVLE